MVGVKFFGVGGLGFLEFICVVDISVVDLNVYFMSFWGSDFNVFNV